MLNATKLLKVLWLACGGAKGGSARKRPRRAAAETLSDAAEGFSVALYERSKRLTIAHYFVDVLDCQPEVDWDVNDGAISIIQLRFNAGSRNAQSCHRRSISLPRGGNRLQWREILQTKRAKNWGPWS